jgi:acetoin utilization deacetylase AcuC-like enzyme
MKLEVPYSPELVRAFWLAAGGTIVAAESALQDGFGCNLGGGFHHAYPGHGEGFCAIHDVAVAIRALQARQEISRAMIVDTDVHHGNGTAAIFAKDPSVFTLSIHQWNNYPAHKPHSSLDINLEDGVDDEEYLAALLPAIQKSLEEFQPDMLFYVGGADPYSEDQLGGLNLSIAGLKERDAGVFDESRKRGIPVVTTQAGGYARRIEDTVQIHVNTILAAKQIANQWPTRSDAAST